MVNVIKEILDIMEMILQHIDFVSLNLPYPLIVFHYFELLLEEGEERSTHALQSMVVHWRPFRRKFLKDLLQIKFLRQRSIANFVLTELDFTRRVSPDGTVQGIG